MILHPALRIGFATGLLLLASAGPGQAQAPADEVKCSYSRRAICTTAGCIPGESEGIHLLVPPLEALRSPASAEAPVRIQRCDAQGCTPVEVANTASAGFLTFSAMHGAYLFKIYAGPDIDAMELRTGDFTEVVTSLLTTYVGYGSCSVAQP